MAAECFVGHQPEIDHLRPPRHVGIDQPTQEPRNSTWQRLRARDPDVEITRVLTVATGAGAEEEDLEPLVANLIQANPPGLGEVTLLEGRAGRGRGDRGGNGGIVTEAGERFTGGGFCRRGW